MYINVLSMYVYTLGEMLMTVVAARHGVSDTTPREGKNREKTRSP